MPAMALPASMTLPPPMATTTSTCSRRASATPDSTRSVLGSPPTAKGATANPRRRSAANNGAARPGVFPVTRSARFPNVPAATAASGSVPTPNTILVAVANSKRMARSTSSPRSVVRETVPILRARPGHGHHRRHGVPPLRIVRGLLVFRGRLVVPIDLDQLEPCRVVDLLHDIEPRDTRLLHTLPGVFEGSGLESFDGLSLHLNLDEDDEHMNAASLAARSEGGTSFSGAPGCAAAPRRITRAPRPEAVRPAPRGSRTGGARPENRPATCRA